MDIKNRVSIFKFESIYFKRSSRWNLSNMKFRSGHLKLSIVRLESPRIALLALPNPFHATSLFQYSLKTSENQRFSDVFRG